MSVKLGLLQKGGREEVSGSRMKRILGVDMENPGGPFISDRLQVASHPFNETRDTVRGIGWMRMGSV